MNHEVGSASPLGTPRWMRMAIKELREILRDRRTILTLVLMPLLVYPLLGIAFQKLAVSQAGTTAKVEYHIGVANNEQVQLLTRMMQQGARALGRGNAGNGGDESPRGTLDDPIVSIVAPPDGADSFDVERLVANRVVDLGVVLLEKPTGEGGTTLQAELLTHASFPASRDARQFVEDRLRAFNFSTLRRELRQQALPIPPTVDVTRRSVVVDGEKPSGFSLATLVPLVLLLMTVTGAVYPAIDLTAGERERGTLEPLMAAPVPRQQILLGKYVAVLVVALMTAVANLIAMTATLFGTGLQSLLFGSGGLTLLLFGQILCLLVVFAGFFSAVLLAITSFARSFKEAQAYLIPLMLVSLAPGILSLTPGLDLGWGLSLLPLANLVLATRDLLEGRLDVLWGSVVLVSTLVYTILALMAASRIFGADALLQGGQGSWQDLWQRPNQHRARASLGETLGMLVALVPIFVLVSGIPAAFAKEGWTFAGRLVLSSLVSLALFVGFPAFVLWWRRVNLRTGFQLERPTILAVLAAGLFGLSLWPWIYELELLTLSPERLEFLKGLFESIRTDLESVPVGARLAALAVVPAVGEELFFRGVIVGGLKERMNQGAVLAISALAFGLFHVLVRDTLLFERLLPSTALGLVLGWVCLKSGSVLPGMILHITHNGLLILIDFHKERLTSWGIGMDERTHLPWEWLAGSAAAVVVATGIIALMQGRQTSQTTESAVLEGANLKGSASSAD